MDDIEVHDRKMDTQVQMILEQQNKLIHSYYALDRKYQDVAKENKVLKNEFFDLKKRLDPSSIVSPNVLARKHKKLGSFSSNISVLEELWARR